MLTLRPAHLFAVVLSAVCSLSHAAGHVEVSFVAPDQFVDVGDSPLEIERNTQALASFLQDLGRRFLSPDQALTVQVLDVDLAGRTWPWSLGNPDLRVMTGRADWPRITLRFTLESDGKVVKSGERTISDMNYQSLSIGYRPTDPMRYEKHLLETWLRQDVLAPVPGS